MMASDVVVTPLSKYRWIWARQAAGEPCTENLVVALTHTGLTIARSIARETPEFDVVLSGHTHERTAWPIIENSVIVVEPGAFSSWLGRLDLILKPGGGVAAHEFRLIAILADRYEEDPHVKALVDASLAPRHLLVWMLSLFGGLALFIAAIGIYGLLSFLATQRTVEVGVRMALGANRVDIAYLIARRILPLLAAGLGVGIVLVIVAQRTLTHFFAAMSGGSVSSIAGAALILLVAAMVAALLPALRAARLQPSVALRNE